MWGEEKGTSLPPSPSVPNIPSVDYGYCIILRHSGGKHSVSTCLMSIKSMDCGTLLLDLIRQSGGRHKTKIHISLNKSCCCGADHGDCLQAFLLTL